MRQFFETYRGAPKLAPLVRELSWTHNLLIVGKCKRAAEREFFRPSCTSSTPLRSRRQKLRYVPGGAPAPAD